MDVEVRPAQAEELDAAGQLAAQAYVDDGLLDFGEPDRYAAAPRYVRACDEQAECWSSWSRSPGSWRAR